MDEIHFTKIHEKRLYAQNAHRHFTCKIANDSIPWTYFVIWRFRHFSLFSAMSVPKNAWYLYLGILQAFSLFSFLLFFVRGAQARHKCLLNLHTRHFTWNYAHVTGKKFLVNKKKWFVFLNDLNAHLCPL